MKYDITLLSRFPMELAQTKATLPNVVNMAYALPSAPSGHREEYIRHTGRNCIPDMYAEMTSSPRLKR